MLSFKVEGMSCGHCVQSVTQAVQKVAPKAQVAVDLDAGRVDVAGDDRRDALAAAIEEAGYKVAA
jgi:copper chaperone